MNSKPVASPRLLVGVVWAVLVTGVSIIAYVTVRFLL